MAFKPAPSSIAMALAGKTASVDIPKSRSGQPALLPTPPNSISPTLPPQAFKARATNNRPSSPHSQSHVDSDIDLEDAVDGIPRSQPQPATADHDSAGAITPGMLAKYHLPEIMLHQGPLAIRHVMGFLTTSVPGFSRIPPAKARRLVVAALEGRGEGGGLAGDVIFEKVGWGRWDARRRGEPARDRSHLNVSSPPPSLPNSFQSRGMQIPTNSMREQRSPYGTSMAGDSAVFSYTETHFDLNMVEHEADKMSLDGDGLAYCSSSEAPDEEIRDEDWNEGDVTDEEDWAQIGADALRARSLGGSGGGLTLASHVKQPPQLRGGGPASSTLAMSVPQNIPIPIQQFGFSLPDGMVGDKEERAAVEALLRLGSM